eukprot:6180848-Pleurochrysis_carterae.AAC.1
MDEPRITSGAFATYSRPLRAATMSVRAGVKSSLSRCSELPQRPSPNAACAQLSAQVVFLAVACPSACNDRFDCDRHRTTFTFKFFAFACGLTEPTGFTDLKRPDCVSCLDLVGDTSGH